MDDQEAEACVALFLPWHQEWHPHLVDRSRPSPLEPLIYVVHEQSLADATGTIVMYEVHAQDLKGLLDPRSHLLFLASSGLLAAHTYSPPLFNGG